MQLCVLARQAHITVLLFVIEDCVAYCSSISMDRQNREFHEMNKINNTPQIN